MSTKEMDTKISTFFIVIVFAIFYSPTSICAQDQDSLSEWRSYLDNLSGKWHLTGTLGSQDLSQVCVGKWVLNKIFFKMDCDATPPDTSGYKSIYIIGYHPDKKHYIFHLFDVFGGGYSETLGIGKLDKNKISFDFDYPKGTIRNTFVWDKEKNNWKMMIFQKIKNDQWKLFAEKLLIKTE